MTAMQSGCVHNVREACNQCLRERLNEAECRLYGYRHRFTIGSRRLSVEEELRDELASAQAERDEARTEATAADMQLRGALIWAGTFGGYAPGHLKHSAQGAWDEINRLRKLLNESDAERREMKRDFTEFMHDEGAKRFKAEADRDKLRAALVVCVEALEANGHDSECPRFMTPTGKWPDIECTCPIQAALTQARALLTTQDPDTNG